MVIEIHRTGESDWLRYFLAARTPERIWFWNGAGWAGEFAEARLYAFLPEVCRAFERLQRKEHGGRFVEEFEARVTVRLHSGQPLGAEELARFLDRFAELFLPTDGPTENSLVEAEIHWHELRKRLRKEPPAE